MLPYYTNYLNNIARVPSQEYLDDMQAAINANWTNSTQTTGYQNGLYAKQETAVGSGIYQSVEISIDSQIDLGTGMKLSDDYKVFTHKQLTDYTSRGSMYIFNDNYWLSTNVDEIASPIKSVGVRRCNQTLKWINQETGALISYPCIIDYDVSSTQPKYDKDINTANGHITLIVQGNNDTRALRKNDRFIFNGECYKLTGFNNMLQNSDVDENTTLLYYKLYLDVSLPSDDLVNNIANAKDYVYTVSLSSDVTEQVSGYTGQLFAQAYLNGNAVTRSFTWTADGNGSIDSTGKYTLTGTVGSSAVFTCSLGDISKTVTINIVSSITDQYAIVISPLTYNIPQGTSITYSANLYKNGTIQSDNVDVSITGGDSIKCYTLTKNGNNSFTITNNIVSQNPITVEFKSGNIINDIDVNLASMF